MSRIGAGYALLAAFLFGASTPFSKILLEEVSPWLLAGILYLGSGVGLLLIFLLNHRMMKGATSGASLKLSDWKCLATATCFGGIFGPIFLMSGLSRSSASASSLLLNLEGVLTAIIAWVVFKERYNARIIFGIILIVLGGIALSWSSTPILTTFVGPLLISFACLAWAIDNNVTQKISASDPVQIAMIKSLVAGSVNVLLAVFVGARSTSLNIMLWGSVLGFLGYGVSIVFFVLALRHIGAARTGAYFSIAPFVGAILSVLFLNDPVSIQLGIAGFLMGIGVWLNLSVRTTLDVGFN